MPTDSDLTSGRHFENVRLQYADEGRIAIVTMSRPNKLNAMTAGLVQDLHDVLSLLHVDNSLRAIVLTGDGRGFCAGLDLSGYGVLPGTEDLGRVPAGMRVQQHIAALAIQMRSHSKPIIAAVNGPAAGGGLALALASDVRIAAPSAKFNVAFVRIGLSGCDIGVSWMLPRLIGASRAFELLLTGRIVDADEADRIGLVTKVVPEGEVVAAAIETARMICANSPMGVWMTKEVMWSQLEIPSMQAGIDMENRNQIMLSQTADFPEAMKAFLEKRPPSFRFG
jgi:enoyl-CoA hydratase